MRLTSVLLADAAIATPEGKLYIHGGGVDTIFVAQVPALHASVALAVTVLAEAEDRGHPLRLSIEFRGPGDGPALATGGAVAAAVNFQAEHPYATVVAAYTWSPLPLPEFGTYTFVVDAGEAGQLELPLTVAPLTSPAGQTAAPPTEI